MSRGFLKNSQIGNTIFLCICFDCLCFLFLNFMLFKSFLSQYDKLLLTNDKVGAIILISNKKSS